MTRPIFEPSTSRTEAKLGFSADQLFRRPAPASDAWSHLFISTTSDVPYDASVGRYDLTGDLTAGAADFSSDTFDVDAGAGTIKILIPGMYHVEPIIFPTSLSAISSGYFFDITVLDASNNPLNVDMTWDTKRYLAGPKNEGAWNSVFRIYAGPAGGGPDEIVDAENFLPSASAILSLFSEGVGPTYPYKLIFKIDCWITDFGNKVAFGDADAPQIQVGCNIYRMAGPIA